MAWCQVTFSSSTLLRPVQINVLLPADGMIFGGTESKHESKPFKTLYLLHGYGGANSDWLHNTKIAEMSQLFNLAVVMHSGENSFYVDNESNGRLFSSFIGKELVDFTRKIFPLSHDRDDTIIAGLSMGGYGAIHNGLRFNDVFGHVIALSSALVVEGAIDSSDDSNQMGFSRGYWEMALGDLSRVMQSDKNPKVAAKNVLDSKKNITDLYIACGYNDMLVYSNRQLSQYLNEIGYNHVYEEGAGTHEWPFWNDFLKRGLERLIPLPKFDPSAPDGSKPPFWVDAKLDSPNPIT